MMMIIMWIGISKLLGNFSKLLGNSKLLFVSLGFVIAANSFYAPTPIHAGTLKNSDNYIRCDDCHVQQQEEFSRSVVHKTIKCTGCHTISDFGPDLYSHNATTFECIYCHTRQNATQFYNDAHKDNGSSTKMCIACHSNIEFKIELHRYNSTNLTVSAVNGKWAITHTYS